MWVLQHTYYCSFTDMDSSVQKSNIKNKRKLAACVARMVFTLSKKRCMFQYKFTDDAFLQQMNWEHLQHDTLTDIITFDISNTTSKYFEADIYISAERVKENAKILKIPYQQELLRVIIHGGLHLCGYKDKTPNDIKTMRQAEEYWLQKFNEELLNK